jgi:hypothetical protein
MSKSEYVGEELADIERQLAGRQPDATGEDMSDLAAIGLARYDPKITAARIEKLVAEARARGRSWEQIGSRLGLPAEEARRNYEHPSHPGLRAAVVGGGVLGAVLLAVRHLVRNFGGIPRL